MTKFLYVKPGQPRGTAFENKRGKIQIEIATGIGIERNVIRIEALYFDPDPDFDFDFDVDVDNNYHTSINGC